MRSNTSKIERERRIIEHAREQSLLFPPGKLEMDDRPDGRIASAKIGIEVSELLPERSDRATFSGPQLSSFQSEVVVRAARLFSETRACPSDVLIYFRNDWTNKRDPMGMAQAVADFVCANYPQQSKIVCLQRGRVAVGWVDGLSLVRITAQPGRWQAAGNGDGVMLTYEQLASRIAEKSDRVQEYRKRLPGWQIWLLLATRISVLSSVSVPSEIESWRFPPCLFDRVFLSSWDVGVIQLSCAQHAS
jgi:hypothetical protein